MANGEQDRYGNRSDDKFNKLSRITSQNPISSLALASSGSIIASLIAVFALVTDPLKNDISELKGSVEIARAHIHEINAKIGSKPRAAGDVNRIYGMISGIKRELDLMHNRLNRAGGAYGPSHNPIIEKSK